MYGHKHVMVYMWRSQDNWRKLDLFFYHVGPRGQTWVSGLGCKPLSPTEPPH